MQSPISTSSQTDSESPKRSSHWGWAFLLLLLIPLQEIRPGSTPGEYDRTRELFLRGYLEKCQLQAEREYRRSAHFNSALADRFLLLEVEAMEWRGLHGEALDLLSSWPLTSEDAEETVRERVLEGVALDHLQQFAMATYRLNQAEHLCAKQDYASCGSLLRARGTMLVSHGDLPRAREKLLASLAYARLHRDQFAEATAFLNLAVASIQSDRFDEAVDWSNSALKMATNLRAEDLAQNALGNLGWAYFKLGDSERALLLFDQAQKNANRVGDSVNEIEWLADTAYVDLSTGDLDRALNSDIKYLKRAKEIDSKADVIDALEDLAHISIAKNDFEQASRYIEQVWPLIRSNDNRLDQLDIMLAQGAVAAGRHQDTQAEEIFRAVDKNPSAETSMKLGAERALAALYERQNDLASTDRMYRTALRTFESARDQLRTETSKLPFSANATLIYDDYIHFLIAQHRTDEALLVADQSRARTLAQGLGIGPKDSVADLPKLRPADVARRSGATLLFYWLGAKQSYLWAISATGTSLFTLPPQQLIKDSIDRYRKKLLGFGDPLQDSDLDGAVLFKDLIAPAAALIAPNSEVIVLSDAALSQLSFESLIVPAPHPHYWIEDATISSAPSLQMLASSHPAISAQRKILLIGDAISPGPDYPNLPMASTEMQQIQQQVGTRNATVFSREHATPAAYLDAGPQQFVYVHFVAHGVASPTDPLDSSIILSRSSSAEDSFKLHARDIIQHPIRADLVTISACYGSGTRSFAGEGPVGLAWAFLRAGAHNVIGALWEVSDQSTPQLMGDLYRGLDSGLPPSAALRQAKLALMHSNKEFGKPFYWAPLQVYTGR